jgi:sortase (surface protein transpeptidase)
MFNVSTGNKIIVTDAKGSPTTYKITRIFKVDDYGVNPSDGENYYNYLTSTRGGEVITLQTCINSNLNLIIRAEKIS